MAQVPLKLIDEHLKLRDYGIKTQNSSYYLSFPCIKKFEDIRKQQKSWNFLSDDEFLDIIPRRTTSIDTIDTSFAILAHPKGTIRFNDMAGKIFELCSGKYRLREIIQTIRENEQNLPPEPYFSRQVMDSIKDMHKRYLIAYSDL